MARKYLVPIDLTQQELQNARIQNLASAPSSPVAGQVYFNTTVNALYFYNGTTWVNAASSVAQGTLSARPAASASNANSFYFATDNSLLYVSNGSTWTQANSFGSGASSSISITGTSGDGTSTSYARADHTHAGPGFGSPASLSFGGSASDGTASTVSRSDHSHAMPAHDGAAHSLISLSDLAAPTDDLSIGTQKLTNVVDPTSAQDAATKNYVDTRKVTDLTAPTSDFSMNSHKITNLADPVNPSDAANKAYVDGAISGLDWKTSVNLLANTNVPLTGSTGLVIDSHDPLGDADDGYRILLTGQSTAADNGIYVYTDNGTTYTLTRAEDANQYQELINASVFVSEGLVYGKTSWVQANHYLTSFAGQEWVQFSGQGTYVAGSGLTLTGNSFSVDVNAGGGLQIGVDGLEVKKPENSGLSTSTDGLAVGAGTGITVSGNSVAIDTAVVARKYSETLTGALTNNVYVTHNFGTKDVTVQVYTVADGSQVEVDVTRATNDSVILGFAVAPSSGVYRAVVIG